MISTIETLKELEDLLAKEDLKLSLFFSGRVWTAELKRIAGPAVIYKGQAPTMYGALLSALLDYGRATAEPPTRFFRKES